MKKIKNHLPLIALFLFALGIFVLTLRINIFRYNNFDFGKFDLGNMNQMIWNTLHGRPLYLTDYFGANVPRWAMSHVDPILLVFVPIFAVYQHPLTIVVAQILLVLSSAFIIYKIAILKFKSPLTAASFGFAFLFYPAVGFLNAWTGFHGVTAVIPFFLLAFYLFEKMHLTDTFTKKNISVFYLFLILTMMGKEQLPLYIVMFGVFILFFRSNLSYESIKNLGITTYFKTNYFANVRTKLGISMIGIGLVWFVIAFFIIIPAYAHYRVEGFQRFTTLLDIDVDDTSNVANDNYFLSRYELFGDTYSEVIFGIITNPKDLVKVVFGGDKPKNLKETFLPVSYMPLLYPPLFILAFPDLLINYATSAGGIGTSEIYNHRISMIIPILFISTIYAVYMLSSILSNFFQKLKFKNVALMLALLILASNIYTSFAFNNPIYLWLTQAIKKRLPAQVFAKTASELDLTNEFTIGERYRLTPLENKDRECALKVVNTIPKDASVSGPDYLGAHLGIRETYAIFPALYNSADYVIVDVFSQKILRILDLDVTLVRDVVSDLLKDSNYNLTLGCGNLFVFKNIGGHLKDQKLPLQERYKYEEKVNLEIFQSLTIVDYVIPQEFIKGNIANVDLVYVKREETRLDDYVLFMTYVNDTTGEIYQLANLPSFSLNQPANWAQGRYYLEKLEVVMPEFLESGKYRVFIGMSNNVRTRSIYLGDTIIN